MRFLERVERIFLGSCMLFTSILLFVNVMLRYFFHSGIFWVEETLRYLMVWIIFIGIVTCVRDDSHICVDIINHSVPKKWQKYVVLMQQLIGILFSGLFCYYSVLYVLATKSSGQVAATIGSVPMWIIYLCLPISMGLYCICSIYRFYQCLREKPEDASEAKEVEQA